MVLFLCIINQSIENLFASVQGCRDINHLIDITD